jgi:hypothetical protein
MASSPVYWLALVAVTTATLLGTAMPCMAVAPPELLEPPVGEGDPPLLETGEELLLQADSETASIAERAMPRMLNEEKIM